MDDPFKHGDSNPEKDDAVDRVALQEGRWPTDDQDSHEGSNTCNRCGDEVESGIALCARCNDDWPPFPKHEHEIDDRPGGWRMGRVVIAVIVEENELVAEAKGRAALTNRQVPDRFDHQPKGVRPLGSFEGDADLPVNVLEDWDTLPAIARADSETGQDLLDTLDSVCDWGQTCLPQLFMEDGTSVSDESEFEEIRERAQEDRTYLVPGIVMLSPNSDKDDEAAAESQSSLEALADQYFGDSRPQDQ